jgi:hypothetical protein
VDASVEEPGVVGGVLVTAGRVRSGRVEVDPGAGAVGGSDEVRGG